MFLLQQHHLCKYHRWWNNHETFCGTQVNNVCLLSHAQPKDWTETWSRENCNQDKNHSPIKNTRFFRYSDNFRNHSMNLSTIERTCRFVFAAKGFILNTYRLKMRSFQESTCPRFLYFVLCYERAKSRQKKRRVPRHFEWERNNETVQTNRCVL